MSRERELLGSVVKGLTQRDDDQGGADEQATRRRRRRPPITDKGRGRNLKIPDSVYRRLELESIERGEDKSRVVTTLLDRHLPHFSLSKVERPADEKRRSNGEPTSGD
jgi:hypothetical protein